MSFAVSVAVAFGVIGLVAVVWKLFFAPIVPPGYESILKMPFDPKTDTRFGKYFGDIPFGLTGESHLEFHDLVKKFGPIVRRRAAMRNVIVVGKLSIGERILKDKEHFSNRGWTGINVVAPHGLLALDTNEEWRAHRAAITPMFAERYMKIYSDAMFSVTHKLIDQFDQLPEDKDVEMHAAISAISLDVLCMAGFGSDFDAVSGKGDSYVHAGDGILQGCVDMTVIPLSLYGWIMPKQHDAFVKGSTLFTKAILDTLSSMGDESSHMLSQLHKAGLTKPSDLIDELLTIVVAGHETSANAMTWLLYLLSQNKEHYKILQKEIDEVYSDPSFSEENIYDLKNKLPYLKASLLETLRLYPTVPLMPRVCTKSVNIEGYDFYPGLITFMSSYAAFHNAEDFPEPEKFDPTRFLNKETVDGELFYPFGAGTRICVGRRFAMLEMTMVMAMFFRRYEFDLNPATKDKVKAKSHITLTPMDGVHMFVRQRRAHL